jgi:hypothetical protein
MRHRYQKDPNSTGTCKECNQGRSEEVHRMLIWRKASSGAYIAYEEYGSPGFGTVFRCKQDNEKTWWSEVSGTDGDQFDWQRIASNPTLPRAKAACEQHRKEP